MDWRRPLLGFGGRKRVMKGEGCAVLAVCAVMKRDEKVGKGMRWDGMGWDGMGIER